MTEVRGAVAYLTGAADGLGRAIAEELARRGMQLALFDIQGAKLTALSERLAAFGTTTFAYSVDLSDAKATQMAVEAALSDSGPPRVLIHDAAILKEREIGEVTFDEWRREVDTSLQAAFILSKAVWPAMVRAHSGSIIFVSSGSALSGFVKETAYTPAKHGQEGLMKVLALQGRPHNIAVNTITTGAPIDTPMSHSHYTADMKVGMVSPARLAPAFGYLASLDATNATGMRFDAFQLSEAMAWARTHGGGS
ncbi:MAG: SDR family NAD(P)-dependent oxidoreductase [Candidatus Dormibacteraeota bacterium]|jgi:NAD(P)-dependent dehydrogenase (short-subunit alcohol dehydrogenase family)|nr:SDR family NAD(P)-dependent oxidoreductase [Candidatus Dormibacteraeota bacterium]